MAKKLTTAPKNSLKPFHFTKCLLSCLNEREQDILKRRHALTGKNKETLEGIGKGYAITRERVRQIERASLQKIKRLVNYKQELNYLIKEVQEVLEKFGGIIEHNHLIQELLARFNISESGQDHKKGYNHLAFLIDEFLNEFFHAIPQDEVFKKGWSNNPEHFKKAMLALEQIEEFLLKKTYPQDHSKIARHIGLKIDAAYSYLHFKKSIGKNAFGLWGMLDWPEITPRRMADRIYLVLKKYKEPLHYKDIARYIEEHYARPTHAPTIHNELIADPRFVLVGRGIYALSEWGYVSGTVSQVVEKILKENKKPLSRDRIVERVRKQRLVARSTILLAINSSKNITKVGKDKYKLV